jgi:L-asparaginase
MKIAFIQTGGTIDKDYPKSEKGWAFEIDEPAYLRILKKLNPSFEYSSVLGLKKDSLEITQSDRQKLFDLCKSIDCHKIIITHGTDTLLETAAFLQKIPGKVILLTGAMRPERFANSDASINLGVAIGAVQVLSEGVYIAMHGLVLLWQKVKRDKESGQFMEK